MAEIKKEEAMFHDAIKGFLGKREQGLVMGHFRAVLSANAGKVDIKDGEIERLRQMVNDLRDDACDCDACSAARDYMASVESTAQQAIDEPIDRYGRTAAQERQRQIDNRLLQLIQRFFPSLPVAPGYTDWSHWLRFANEAAKIHASQPLAEVKP